MAENLEQLVTVTEAAAHLGISCPTLERWVRLFDAPHTVVAGRKVFDKAELDRWAAENLVDGRLRRG